MLMRVLILLLLFAFCQSTIAKPKKTQPIAVSAPVTYALWNINTDQYITGDHQEDVRPIASMTKLMSALVTLNGNLNMDELLTVTGKETSSRIRQGMQITRQKLLELSLISSDNLATRTLAESYPGGYSKFLDDMNRTADVLGMSHTKYVDSTGLLADNISNADDIRKLILAVSPWNIFTSAGNSAKVVINALVPGKKQTKTMIITGNNTNNFVGKLDIVAAKTGYTSKAGRCLTMLFNYNNSQYALVVMGASTSTERKKIVEQMLDKIKYI